MFSRLRVVTPMAKGMPRRLRCTPFFEMRYETFGFLPKRRSARRTAGTRGMFKAGTSPAPPATIL
jgi:hypothetical protein